MRSESTCWALEEGSGGHAYSHAHESYQGEKDRGTVLKKMSSAIKVESSGSERLVIKGLFSDKDVNDEREIVGEYNLSEDSFEK